MMGDVKQINFAGAGGASVPGGAVVSNKDVISSARVIPSYLYCPLEEVQSIKDFKEQPTYSEGDMKNLKMYFGRLPKAALLQDMKAMKTLLTMKFLVEAYN